MLSSSRFSRPSRPSRLSRLVFESLEPRLLLSAALTAPAFETVVTGHL
ncbi:MAG: LEPR-XLL domain-containing protein [Nitrospirae bacterium]|nr:LEPR-XLL domain-containing protein [Nitrospirota bacterium]